MGTRRRDFPHNICIPRFGGGVFVLQFGKNIRIIIFYAGETKITLN